MNLFCNIFIVILCLYLPFQFKLFGYKVVLLRMGINPESTWVIFLKFKENKCEQVSTYLKLVIYCSFNSFAYFCGVQISRWWCWKVLFMKLHKATWDIISFSLIWTPEKVCADFAWIWSTLKFLSNGLWRKNVHGLQHRR